MLTWNSSDIEYFNPLIQQKRMYTGKGQQDVPQGMLQYRGVPFTSKQYGILNVTGINEAVAFGMDVNSTIVQLTWDSVLSRAVDAQFTGKYFLEKLRINPRLELSIFLCFLYFQTNKKCYISQHSFLIHSFLIQCRI